MNLRSVSHTKVKRLDVIRNIPQNSFFTIPTMKLICFVASLFVLFAFCGNLTVIS